MGDGGSARERVAIVTVHGTGDTAAGSDGDKWFQNGSAFIDRLKRRLAGHNIEADVIPYLWSGANSAQAREKGAEKLARTLKRHANTHGGHVHVIGHSHGGNVANDAATILNWRRRPKRKQKIASITTVGTPYFRGQLSAAETFGGMVFVGVLVLTFLGLLLGLFAALDMVMSGTSNIEEAYQNLLASAQQAGAQLSDEELLKQAQARVEDQQSNITGLAFILILGLVLLFMFKIGLDGLGRIMRLGRRKNPNASIYSIWHPNDEAISFLQRVETLKIEPFSRGALWRGSRTAGIVWGVRAVILTAALGAILWINGLITHQHFPPNYFLEHYGSWLSQDLMASVDLNDANGISYVYGGVFFMVSAIVGAPLTFFLVYLITRILVYGVLLELAMRGWLNTSIAGVLRGMAYGQDGDERIGQVATCSHAFEAQCQLIEGEMATRMQAASQKAADELIEKYRWALFQVGPDTNTAINDLANDAMTWNSLIHTSYFDQPEVADMIGDYIAAQVRSSQLAAVG